MLKRCAAEREERLRGKKGMREVKARETLSASRKLILAAWTSSKHVGPTGPVEPPFASSSTFSLSAFLSLSFPLPLCLSSPGTSNR